jgi:hypothetical protein
MSGGEGWFVGNGMRTGREKFYWSSWDIFASTVTEKAESLKMN